MKFAQPAIDLQKRLLPGVSRTFALTIPQLPQPLATVVGNAYLLCRLADTIEDEPALSPDQKHEFHQRLVSVVKKEASAKNFAADLLPLLTDRTLPDERELVSQTEDIVDLTHHFENEQRDAVVRCVSIMCDGMPQFQRVASRAGLGSLEDLNRYCYFVAGVVGEMLTDLFCLYSPKIAQRRPQMSQLAVSFGQGLQMTNILKDIWDDWHAGFCWLPRDRFGGDLADLTALRGTSAFAMGLEDLLGVAHRHLRYALEYSYALPIRERGIRRFCLWALGMAVLTLRNIHRNPHFASSAAIKIPRRQVRSAIGAINFFLPSNVALRGLFKAMGGSLPLAPASLVRPLDGVSTA